jgi:hypothetical protein
MDIPEDFLHYVWQFRSFNCIGLATTMGESLKIFSTGLHNKDAGPDFSNAKIQIGNTIWAGQVEIHLKSSDWIKHHHQNDGSYDNVILHVVLEHDEEIVRKDGSVLPVLVLKERIPDTLIDKYYSLILNLNDFPCKVQIKDVDPLIVNSFLSRVAIERFELKTSQVLERLAQLKGNWDETFYHFLARNFGFKVNALPFELLAKALPQYYFAKHKDQPAQIEALVFGAAGFLNDRFTDEYPAKLKQEFDYLKKKYRIKPLAVNLWKFMRMRPQNFPTLRLAQFAALIVQSNHLFSKVMAVKDVIELRRLFEKLPVNDYWKHHYHFKKEVEGVGVQIGQVSVDNILLNTVALFLFAYGKHTANQSYINRAIQLLEHLPAESNAITERFVAEGIKMEHAFASQGILQLKKQYCDQKKCLSCGIGIKILKGERVED